MVGGPFSRDAMAPDVCCRGAMSPISHVPSARWFHPAGKCPTTPNHWAMETADHLGPLSHAGSQLDAEPGSPVGLTFGGPDLGKWNKALPAASLAARGKEQTITRTAHVSVSL